MSEHQRRDSRGADGGATSRSARSLGCVPSGLSAQHRARPIEDVPVDWERFVARPRPVRDVTVVWPEAIGA